MVNLSPANRFYIATFIAILFHVCGCIGMFTSYKDWFINSTPVNLLLMFALLVWTHTKINKALIAFFFLCVITGMAAEIIGVHTSLLFGHYTYGTVLGWKFMNVPWLIGINWFVIMYTSAMAVSQIHGWVEQKFVTAGSFLSPQLKNISLIVDGALLTTFFDFIMEPVAVKLGYWYWLNGSIPFLNYLCWFVISMVLLYFFTRLHLSRRNRFAVHLLIIQLLFFGVLRTFL